MAVNRLKSEFQMSRIFYNYHDHRVFFCSQWRFLHAIIFACVRLLLSIYLLFVLVHYFVFVSPHTSIVWRFPHAIIFVLIRLLLSIYSLFSLVHYFVRVSPSNSIMIYFTTWSYIMLTLHLTLAAVLSLVFYKDVHHMRVIDVDIHSRGAVADSTCIEISHIPAQINSSTMSTNGKENGLSVANNNSSNLPTGNGASSSPFSKKNTAYYFKLSWCLSDINTCSAPIVTSIYFAAIFPSTGGSVGLVDTNVHMLNTVFVVIDSLVSARPVRLLHLLAPTVYGICWVVFSIIYWSTDHVGHIVYDMIDWNSPGMTMVWVVGILVFMIVLKVIYFGLHYLKIWLYTVIHKEDYFIDVDRD